jgi:hypothetical protein
MWAWSREMVRGRRCSDRAGRLVECSRGMWSMSRAVDEGTGRGGAPGARLEEDRVLVSDHSYDDESTRADNVPLLSVTRTTMSSGAAAETPRSTAVVPFLAKCRPSPTSLARLPFELRVKIVRAHVQDLLSKGLPTRHLLLVCTEFYDVVAPHQYPVSVEYPRELSAFLIKSPPYRLSLFLTPTSKSCWNCCGTGYCLVTGHSSRGWTFSNKAYSLTRRKWESRRSSPKS